MHVLLEEAFKIKTLLFKTCTTDYCPYQPCIAKKKKKAWQNLLLNLLFISGFQLAKLIKSLIVK